jgi:hypothetical protein
MILTVDVPGRNDLTQEGCTNIVDHSTLRDCLETAIGADVSIKVDIVDCTDVVFLRELDSDDIFAVFPAHAACTGRLDLMVCYSHVGQHSSACWDYCCECDEVTDPNEYEDLLAELQSIGYSLRVISKDRAGGAKYRNSRKREAGL